MGFIIYRKSYAALLILAGFHIVTALIHLMSLGKSGWMGEIFLLYHLIVAVVIYFHDWFEKGLRLKKS